jgi:tRNA threonylcarbamoyl adenosine modification protein YeaZ
MKIILALEFSTAQRSVAVARSDSGDVGPCLSEVIETGERAVNALGMIEEALLQARLEREQIECLAIGLGPGSYNGIRTAIALAQGWQLAAPVKLLGISSAECLAAQAQSEGITGRVTAVIDAQRSEFYLTCYEINPQNRTELQPLHIATMAQVQQHAEAGELLIGPDVKKSFPGRVIFPRAAMLAQLALNRTDFVPGERLQPIYLRETTFVKAPPPHISF